MRLGCVQFEQWHPVCGRTIGHNLLEISVLERFYQQQGSTQGRPTQERTSWKPFLTRFVHSYF